MSEYAPITPIEPLIIDRSRLSELAGFMAMLAPGAGVDAYEEVLRGTLPTIAWKERYASRKEIRLKPPENPAFRRCARVVAMVNELHKVGYQKIRAIPQEAPNGSQWRCNITYAANVEPDGFTLKKYYVEDEGHVAHYSTGQGADYFGWTDASSLSARELAVLFLKRYPLIMELGQGRDWLYAGWLTDFMGLMENADALGLFTFTADYPLDPVPIDPWVPPPPR
ncbi:MAG: hypothetical protein V4707_03090 [Pseudomonadota bacterium]